MYEASTHGMGPELGEDTQPATVEVERSRPISAPIRALSAAYLPVQTNVSCRTQTWVAACDSPPRKPNNGHDARFHRRAREARLGCRRWRRLIGRDPGSTAEVPGGEPPVEHAATIRARMASATQLVMRYTWCPLARGGVMDSQGDGPARRCGHGTPRRGHLDARGDPTRASLSVSIDPDLQGR
jgi:hypothetical protein